MRAFIAIKIPEEIKAPLVRLQTKLKSTGADVKWVAPQNIHLTLKFLGDINEEQVEKIGLIMEKAAKDQTSYQADICSVGGFPSINSARVIWAGLEQGDNETKTLAKTLEEKIQKIGIPKEERSFSSHITLGRTRSQKNKENLAKELLALENSFKEKPLGFTVGTITLFSSTLSPGGPIYEVAKEISLSVN